jgi:hypothetical protein
MQAAIAPASTSKLIAIIPHDCLLQPWDVVELHSSHPRDGQTLASYGEAVEGLLIDQSSHFIDVNLNALTLQILA